MGRVASRTDWLGQMECLTVQPEGSRPSDQLDNARARIARLAVSARPLAEATPDYFAGLPYADEAAALARELAVVAPGPGRLEPPLPSSDRPVAVLAYLQALRDAASAVYYCRRVSHPAGSCWFSVTGPDADVCGRVLALTHCLRAALQAPTR